MRLLVLGDDLQVVVEGGVETGGGELRLGVVGQTLTVEFVLEVLQGERIVKDCSLQVSSIRGETGSRIAWREDVLSRSVKGAACLLTGLAVDKPAAATRATTD